MDASIYFGCLADRSGHPKAWIEIWVQNVDREAPSEAEIAPDGSDRVGLGGNVDPLTIDGGKRARPVTANVAAPTCLCCRDPSPGMTRGRRRTRI